jgi:hypothetical protein
VRPEELNNLKKKSLYRESNPRPCGLWLGALTTTLARAPKASALVSVKQLAIINFSQQEREDGHSSASR